MKLLGTINEGFDVTDQLLIRFSDFVRYWTKNENAIRQYSNYARFEVSTAVATKNVVF
jgi:hypothetical protein